MTELRYTLIIAKGGEADELCAPHFGMATFGWSRAVANHSEGYTHINYVYIPLCGYCTHDM